MATIIKFAETDAELNQILQLQQSNHFYHLTDEEKRLNGFVTVKHDIELLKKMNAVAKQIIAIDNDVVVGYALVMLREFSEVVPVLQPMFHMFNQLSYLNKPLDDYSYYVMGQICIAATHRGQGIFEKLYLKHQEAYSSLFELCLTEISQYNLRSMKAHLKVGFKTIHSFQDETDYWNIMLWDWRNA
jgi:ribosomal protein S18 acetylase RimI-like enzyme